MPHQNSIPAGTVFTDPTGNFSYSSNSSTTIPGYSCNPTCHPPTVSVSVTATNVGSNYNIGAASGYTSNGTTSNGVSMSNFNMNGSSMNGGSSQNVQVVAAADVSSAQSQLTAPSGTAMQTQLAQNSNQLVFSP